MSSAATERVIPIKILDGPSDSKKANQSSGDEGQKDLEKRPSSPPVKVEEVKAAEEDSEKSLHEGVVTEIAEEQEVKKNEETLKIEEIEDEKEKSPKIEAKERSNDKVRVETKEDTIEVKTEERVSEKKIRYVPIRLPDGRTMSRDPDETMEIKTEFTNYCKQEFPDSKSAPSSPVVKNKTTRSRHKSEGLKNGERVVPIKLDNGEDFMPVFTQLEDLEPPEWSAFNAKNRSKNESKEKIVPIRMEEGQQPKPPRKKSSMKAPADMTSSSTEGSPIRTTRRTTTRTNKEKTTKSHEKRVQHTVRFMDEEEDASGSSGAQKRSSSVDGGPTARIPATRERHRSGGGGTVGSNKDTPVGRSTPEKTLHDIDRDINKIWRELQELDALPTSSPPSSTRPPSVNGLPRRGSPARGATVTPNSLANATPVKIRTYTTALPSSISANSAPPSRTSSPYKRTIFDHDSSYPIASLATTPLPKPTPTVTTPSHIYNPQRKDLEPTRPGAITPVYSTSPQYKNKTTDTNGSINKTTKPSTVLHLSKESNGVEFYPRFELRPRAESLQREEREQNGGHHVQNGVRSSRFDQHQRQQGNHQVGPRPESPPPPIPPPPAVQLLTSTALQEDKACQTDDLGKKSAKCSLQWKFTNFQRERKSAWKNKSCQKNKFGLFLLPAEKNAKWKKKNWEKDF